MPNILINLLKMYKIVLYNVEHRFKLYAYSTTEKKVYDQHLILQVFLYPLHTIFGAQIPNAGNKFWEILGIFLGINIVQMQKDYSKILKHYDIIFDQL